MKLQSCGPGFVDALDADAAFFGGAHADLLWAAFARRGLGFSAEQGSPNSTTDNTEAFDLPPTTSSEQEDVPPSLVLRSVAPNPASGEVLISYVLPAPGPVRLTVFDVCGRTVARLADGARGAGPHTVRVATQGWASGVYVLRLEAEGTVQTRRFTVAR